MTLDCPFRNPLQSRVISVRSYYLTSFWLPLFLLDGHTPRPSLAQRFRNTLFNHFFSPLIGGTPHKVRYLSVIRFLLSFAEGGTGLPDPLFRSDRTRCGRLTGLGSRADSLRSASQEKGSVGAVCRLRQLPLIELSLWAVSQKTVRRHQVAGEDQLYIGLILSVYNVPFAPLIVNSLLCNISYNFFVINWKSAPPTRRRAFIVCYSAVGGGSAARSRR